MSSNRYSERIGKSSFFLYADFCQTPGGPSDPSPGGTPDGFNSCTESLGFESSDERTGGKRGEEIMNDYNSSKAWGRARRRSEERRRVVQFPPPLTSMDDRGHRDFVLRSVRKDGRLELTEVRIRRPEIMLATRENGRLTLHLVGDQEEEEQEQEQEEKEIIEEELGSPATGEEGGEAAPRRCYEYDVAGHRDLSVWSPRCVTTI